MLGNRPVQVGAGHGAIRGGGQEGGPKERGSTEGRPAVPGTYGGVAKKARSSKGCTGRTGWPPGRIGYRQEREAGAGADGRETVKFSIILPVRFHSFFNCSLPHYAKLL